MGMAMDSPMPVTTLFPTLTLLAHPLSPTPCPLSPILTQLQLMATVTMQVSMVIPMPTVAFTAMDLPKLPLPLQPNAKSVMPTPRPPPRLTPRPRLPLMPGTDTTDVPAITVDTTAVDMEAMVDTTAVAMEAMEVTDGANRPNQLHPRPTHPIINHRPTTSFYIQILKNLEKK